MMIFLILTLSFHLSGLCQYSLCN